ncbi:cysteine/serine-rich nuclear protein 1-like [Montipora capricornis]|uniref:cysteine/serine-rich nuclear protein 1-like n=1 Tax=Montipora capricornis TaxID=246305 RepID=UPI0035F103AE
MGKRKRGIDNDSSRGDDCERVKIKRVSFGEATIYHFPRKQGFVAVPLTGGSTLGMARKHSCIETVQLDPGKANGSKSNRKPLALISQSARESILKAAGVRRIVKREERDCNEIRQSRVTCGCDCGDICSPETCECSLSGIDCQVDFDRFPCSCQTNDCHNDNGRKEYDVSAIKKHYSETFVKVCGNMQDRENAM